MQMLVLAAIVLSLALTEPQVLAELLPPGWHVLAAAGGYLAGAAVFSRLRVVALRSLNRSAGSRLRRGFRAATSALAPLWLVAGQAALVAGGYGRWVMTDLGLGKVPLAGEVVTLVPFLAALLLTWAVDYPLHLHFRQAIALAVPDTPAARAFWTRREYLDYNCRHHLLFVAAPVAVILLARDLLYACLAPRLGESDLAGAVLLGGMAVVAGGVFLLAPAMIVRIWRTRRLPDGPLRADLEGMCARLNLRFRDILVWRTGGVVANAAVMGLTGRTRYVLLSDALLENLPPEAVRSIFAHEAGHIAHHHILHSLVFTVAAAVLCQVAVFTVADAAGWGEWTTDAAALATIAAVWLPAFGWISRRFERQSDVTAAWLTGVEGTDQADSDRISHEGAAIFAFALERIALLNGIPPERHNWRHGSISERISHVLWLGSTARTRRGADRAVRRIQVGVWLLLAAAVALAVWTASGEPPDDQTPAVMTDEDER